MARYIPQKSANIMQPRKLTPFTAIDGPVIKAANAPRPALEDALEQFKRYLSRQRRLQDKQAEERFQKAFEQGKSEGFRQVLAQVPETLVQQQQLMENWLSWLKTELEQRLPGLLMTPLVLDNFIKTLTREFSITEATLWLPRSVAEEAGSLEQRCRALGISRFNIKIHEHKQQFRLEAGPMVWVFDARKQVIQQVVWQLGKPELQK